MSTALLLAASLLTVVTSILSVQIPRYLEHKAAAQERYGPDIPLATVTPPMRKPWDPPFPKPPKHADKKKSWLGLPPALNRQGRVQIDGADEIKKDTENEEKHGRDKETEAAEGIHPVVRNVIAVLACLLFICLFALLIAYSLATFIVYKTEARLGEARRGVSQGGEMRLCLCARG